MTAAETAKRLGLSKRQVNRYRAKLLGADGTFDQDLVEAFRRARGGVKRRTVAQRARRRAARLIAKVDPAARCPHTTRPAPASTCSICLVGAVPRVGVGTAPDDGAPEAYAPVRTAGASPAAGWR